MSWYYNEEEERFEYKNGQVEFSIDATEHNASEMERVIGNFRD